MVDASGMVLVEFYGVARLRAGRAFLAVPAGTVVEVLQRVELACPDLAGLVQPDQRLAGRYLLSLDGRQFLDSLERAIHAGDRLLVLSADAGG